MPHHTLSFNDCVIFLVEGREEFLTRPTAFYGLVGEQLRRAHKSPAVCRVGGKIIRNIMEISRD